MKILNLGILFFSLVSCVTTHGSGMRVTLPGKYKDFALKRKNPCKENEKSNKKSYFYGLYDLEGDHVPTCVEFIKNPETSELWVLFGTSQGAIYAVQKPNKQDALAYIPDNAQRMLPEEIIGCCADENNSMVIVWGHNTLRVIDAHDLFSCPKEIIADTQRISYINQAVTYAHLTQNSVIRNAFFCEVLPTPRHKKAERFIFVIIENKATNKNYLYVNRFEKHVSYPHLEEKVKCESWPILGSVVTSCSACGDLFVLFDDQSIIGTIVHPQYTMDFSHFYVNRPDNEQDLTIRALSPTVTKYEEPTFLSDKALYVMNSTINGHKLIKALDFEQPLDNYPIKKFIATGFHSFGGIGFALVLQDNGDLNIILDDCNCEDSLHTLKFFGAAPPPTVWKRWFSNELKRNRMLEYK